MQDDKIKTFANKAVMTYVLYNIISGVHTVSADTRMLVIPSCSAGSHTRKSSFHL